MDRKAQEIFFDSSVDMEAISESAINMIKTIEEAGNPKRINIEIRREDYFDENLSMDEVFEQIDKEYSKEPSKLDLLRINKADNRYVIIAVKLN